MKGRVGRVGARQTDRQAGTVMDKKGKNERCEEMVVNDKQITGLS